jgi:1-acyl-sn-glycerol-3-phosphate acyltransferase
MSASITVAKIFWLLPSAPTALIVVPRKPALAPSFLARNRFTLPVQCAGNPFVAPPADLSYRPRVRVSGGTLIDVLRLGSVTGALCASGYGYLWAYRASVLWRGADPERAVRMLCHWSRGANRVLGLHPQLEGSLPPPPVVFLANHRSYLDITVLAATLGASFVSRADIASWVLIGPVARAIDCVFVDRDDPHGRVRAARAILRRIRRGSLIIFPEASTFGDRLPQALEPGLFRLLRRVPVPLVPVTVRYSDRRAYWDTDVSLAEHLRHRVLAGGALRASVHIGAALAAADFADADELQRAVHESFCGVLDEFGELA